jgi:opacity protein-like surface antigen
MYKISKLAAGSVIAATAAITGGPVALADGYTPSRVVYQRPVDWSGVYFGVNSGYSWSSTHVENPAFPAAGITSDYDTGIVGIHGGVQHQWGAVLLGVEGGWQSTFRDRGANTADGGSSEACGSPPALVPGGVSECRARMSDVFTIGGRAGWSMGKWLPYVTGGYANGAFDFSARNPAIISDPLVEEAHKRLNGWYIGGGVEWAVSPGWSTGIEYRHYEFDAGTTNAFTPGGAFLENARFDASSDQVTARVTWRWGRPEAAPLK